MFMLSGSQVSHQPLTLGQLELSSDGQDFWVSGQRFPKQREWRLMRYPGATNYAASPGSRSQSLGGSDRTQHPHSTAFAPLPNAAKSPLYGKRLMPNVPQL